MIRPTLGALAAVALLSTAACATGAGSSGYAAELDRLSADCQARGGILTPIAGLDSGAPERDYACKITGQPSSRIN